MYIMELKKQRNMSNKKEKKTKKNKTIKKKIRKEKKGGTKSGVQTFAISEKMMLDKEYKRKIENLNKNLGLIESALEDKTEKARDLNSSLSNSALEYNNLANRLRDEINNPKSLNKLFLSKNRSIKNLSKLKELLNRGKSTLDEELDSIDNLLKRRNTILEKKKNISKNHRKGIKSLKNYMN